MSTYLLVGHGAREYAFAERIREEGHTVVSVAKKPNDSLSRLCDHSIHVTRYRLKEIIKLCESFNPDILIPSDEELIFDGVGGLDLGRIKVLAPRIEWLFFERDKSRFKSFVADVDPTLVPHSKHFQKFEDFICAVEGFPNGFVLKAPPPSKDIVIFKEGAKGVEDEIKTLFEKHAGSGLMGEEYIEGNEFSVHVLFGEDGILLSKPIMDYPFRDEGDLGPKTGGMGAISPSGLNLPFHQEVDYRKAETIIRSILNKAVTQFGPTRGFFSFQFFKSGERLLVNEVDVHPGDPESIALLLSLRTDISEAISNVLHGENPVWEFDDNNTVVQCFTPRAYPSVIVPESFAFNSDSDLFKDHGVRVYWGNSSKLDQFTYETGTSRTLALASAGTSFEDCRTRLSAVNGELLEQLHARTDIGLF